MFDLRVHHFEKKTGKIIKTTPYQLIIENGMQVFKRNGIRYFPDGTRVDMSEKETLPVTKEDIELQNKKLAEQNQELVKKLETLLALSAKQEQTIANAKPVTSMVEKAKAEAKAKEAKPSIDI